MLLKARTKIKQNKKMIVAEKTGGSKFEPIEEGLYPALCVSIAGIGVQETPWGDKEKLVLTFEIPSIEREWEKDGEVTKGRAHISATYTCSLAQKAKLREILESWRGQAFTPEELQGFDLSAILGKSCQVLIKHTHKDDKTYANIREVLKWAGDPLTTETTLANYDPMNHDKAQFDLLPEWIQNKVVPPTAEGIKYDPVIDKEVEELDDEESVPF